MRVLVAFDGSDGARATLHEACRLLRTAADAAGAVDAVWVLDPLVDAHDVPAERTSEAMRAVEARAREETARAIAGESGVTAHALIAIVGPHEDVAACLNRIAGERGADLIAIASRRAAGLAGLALGSVTQELLRISQRPVLVVRA